MAGGRTTNTMSEMLVNMLRELSVAKTLPDADLEFLVGVETLLLSKLRQPLEAAAGQMPMSVGGGMGAMGGGQGAMPGPPPGMPPGMGDPAMGGGFPPPMMASAAPMDAPVPPPASQPGVPGLRAQPQISPDELARTLSNVGA